MNVVVNGPEMIRVATNTDSRVATISSVPSLRCAVHVPQSPGMQVHAGLGKQRGGVRSSGNSFETSASRHVVLGSFLQIRLGSAGKRFAIASMYAFSLGEASRDKIDGLLHGFMRALESVRIARDRYSSDQPLRRLPSRPSPVSDRAPQRAERNGRLHRG